DDTLAGGAGVDAAVFERARREYRFTRLADGALLVYGPSGTDRLSGVERLRFPDGEVTATGILAVKR
ncbi:MAG TPA: hypothetical protein VEB64_06590, partial [Azospirillaceae bacterium]|nr:hypothetical protein [Azospirillaceae bacterium]